MNDPSLDVRARLNALGVSNEEFSQAAKSLEESWNTQPSINDTAWSVLNQRVVKTKEAPKRRNLYWEMAVIVSSEGKNPSQYLEHACEYSLFFGHDELKKIKQLKKEGYLKISEILLLSVQVSPAVLDELRKISSIRARASKKLGDWEKVKFHLEWYNKLAQKYHDECVTLVNQAPPEHTKSDANLLENANSFLDQNQ